jgi:hypothetical protein
MLPALGWPRRCSGFLHGFTHNNKIVARHKATPIRKILSLSRDVARNKATPIRKNPTSVIFK